MKRNFIQKSIAWAGSRKLFNFISDDIYLRLMFWARLDQKLDLSNPTTLNEKIQWLKINDKNHGYCEIVDKYAVRKYISDTLGEDYLIPLVGGPWSSFEQIDINSLPKQFVIKTTHDSGGVVVCKDKDKIDLKETRKKLDNSLKNNYYWAGREYPYKFIKPQIIAEEYMVDESQIELKDYKILCFNGQPDNIMICTGRASGHAEYYHFDLKWNFLPLNYGDNKLPARFTMPKPKCLDEMIKIAKKLSEGYKLIRVDLYEANGRVYFGELTLYPDSGFDTDILYSTDSYFGSRLVL